MKKVRTQAVPGLEEGREREVGERRRQLLGRARPRRGRAARRLPRVASRRERRGRRHRRRGLLLLHQSCEKYDIGRATLRCGFQTLSDAGNVRMRV